METFTVKESRELLLRLLRQYEGTKHYARLLMLLAFREEPRSTNRHVSRDIQIPESTVRRWKGLYAEEGITGLLEMREEQLRHMQELAAAIAPGRPLPPATPEKLISFLNRLPMTSDSIEWSREMKKLLIETFDEVDYALVNVRYGTDLSPVGGNTQSKSTYRQDVFDSEGKDVRSIRQEKAHLPKWRQLLLEGRKNGFPFEKYHPPVGFDYFGGPRAIKYVGSIVLFREKRKPPTSEETLNMFEQTKPFVASLFVYHIQYCQRENPVLQSLFSASSHLFKNAPKLTSRESDVLLLLMLGHSYDEAAEMLYITKGTMISHVRNLYRKLNVTKLSELFARLLMPALDESKHNSE